MARSSFYAASKAKKKNHQLDYQVWQQIQTTWKTFSGWGYRKLAAKLKVNGKRILRILHVFESLPKTKSNKTNLNKSAKFTNLIKKITKDLMANPDKQKRGNWMVVDGKNKYRKLLKPTKPYQLWAGDWKELKVPFLGVTIYIFVIIDCYTRKVMGWRISLIKDGKTAVKVSQMAIVKAQKDPLFNPRNLIMHTDQGSAYQSKEYEKFWRKQGSSLSMADKGKPTQNPYIEAFFSILTRFWLNQYELVTIAEIKQSLRKFFKLYNSQWLHGEIGFITPNQKLEQYRSYLKT